MNRIKSIYDEAKNRLITYHNKINWVVFTLIVFFTIGSWTDLNGMWCELPIMVHELPEGWRLPSVLTILTQASQIGPVVFLIIKWLFPKRISFVFTIYLILGVGALSCLLLSFFWNKTAVIGNEERSIGLYTLVFTLGLLDGTSSVTFLPFIGTNYIKEYIIPNYIGESFSAMVPSIAGIIQGVGQDLGCRNVTVNKTKTHYSDMTTTAPDVSWQLEPLPLIPYFSVPSYYVFLFVMLLIATTSFSLLNFLPVSKRARKNNNEDNTSADKKSEIENGNGNIQKDAASTVNKINENDNVENKPTKCEQIILLGIVLVVSFTIFGVLPGIQTYSTLPFGNDIYHLSINLSYVMLPIVIFTSIFSYKLSTVRIIVEFIIGLIFAAYIIISATYSPCPPLLKSWFGKVLIVISWIVVHNLFMRVRCVVAARLEVCGQRVLLMFGGCIMVGQMIGGIITFLCVDIYRLLQDVPRCVSITDFCAANN